MDTDHNDGSTPAGNLHWKPDREAKARAKMVFNSMYDTWVLPRFTDMPQGQRLTDVRKASMMAKVKDTLSPEEQELFAHCLSNREAALAWDFPECGRIHPDIFPPQEIKTVPHTAWQAKHVPIPKALMPKVIQILEERLKRGTLEESHAAYRNNWFLTMKKDGGLRLINDAQRYNKFTIRDAFIPPNAEEFSEEFGGLYMMSLLDLFSGYDECDLDAKSRDLTTFATPLGLLRLCRLPMGATNSVAQFMRAMTRVLYDLIPHICRPFLDDIGAKAARHDYGGEEVSPGIRRVVAEHIYNLDQILFNCELSGATASAEKSQWCCKEAVLLGYLCTPQGRKPAASKILKLTEWVRCTDVTEVRSFLGLAGFYRLWIRHFGIVARPLYNLLRKSEPWSWTENEQFAMELISHKVTTAPCLAPLEYGEGTGTIYLMVDASLQGWGAVLEQVGTDGLRHPCRFESGIWSNAEKNYDATKRELRGLLYALKRMKRYLYGTHFVVETDAQVLIYQVNGSVSDIPGALLLRWLAWIRHFDFEIRHIAGRRNGAADALSRKPPGPSDVDDLRDLPDIDDAIDADMYLSEYEEVLRGTYAGTRPPRTSEEGDEPVWHEDNTWSRDSLNIAYFLTTGTYPAGVIRKPDRHSFRLRALKHTVLEKTLFLRPSCPSAQPRRVVDNAKDRDRVFTACHSQCGHRGRDSTYHRITTSYYWKGMYQWVEDRCRKCEPCQRHGVKQYEDGARHSIPRSQPFWKINADIQWIPGKRGRKPLIEVRDDLTNYLVARLLKNAKSATVTRFFRHDIILQWGLPVEVLLDNGSEFKGELTSLLQALNIRTINISPYNSRANGINEAGHFPLAQGLAKLMQTTKKDASEVIDYLVWADRTSIKASHGFTPFYLLHGYHPVTEIELDVPTWRMVNWSSMSEMPDNSSPAERHQKLLELRVQALDATGHLFDVAQERVEHTRERIALRRNQADRFKQRPEHAVIQEGDFVLCYDATRKVDRSVLLKATYRWRGPFLVRKCLPSGSYLVRTLDGIDIERPIATGRIKKFWVGSDGTIDVDIDPEENPPQQFDPQDVEGAPSPFPESVGDIYFAAPLNRDRYRRNRRVPTAHSQSVPPTTTSRPGSPQDTGDDSDTPEWHDAPTQLPTDKGKEPARDIPADDRKAPGVMTPPQDGRAGPDSPHPPGDQTLYVDIPKRPPPFKNKEHRVSWASELEVVHQIPARHRPQDAQESPPGAPSTVVLLPQPAIDTDNDLRVNPNLCLWRLWPLSIIDESGRECRLDLAAMAAEQANEWRRNGYTSHDYPRRHHYRPK